MRLGGNVASHQAGAGRTNAERALVQFFDLDTRFLPDDQVRPAAELVTRIVLTYSFNPSDRVDPRDPDSIRRLVRTFLLPAITP